MNKAINYKAILGQGWTKVQMTRQSLPLIMSPPCENGNEPKAECQENFNLKEQLAVCFASKGELWRMAEEVIHVHSTMSVVDGRSCAGLHGSE